MERLCNIETDTVFELERIFVVSILVKDRWHNMDGDRRNVLSAWG